VPLLSSVLSLSQLSLLEISCSH